VVRRQSARQYRQEILSQLKANQGQPSTFFGENYSGNIDPSLHIPTPILRKIAQKFVESHKDLSLSKLIALLDSLYQGTYDDEKQMGGKLLQYYPQLREGVEPEKFNEWLDGLKGWCQVDSLCQSVFTAQEMLGNWDKWRKILIEFSKDKNINKRRASLVLLTGPVRQSTEEKLSQLAFEIIDSLKSEKDPLVTKAISWLLREMIKHYGGEVAAYLKENKESLPKIAVRETKRKLETGRK
jgi:3-methyladenine DNA glycosylase AlkD